MLEVLEMAKRCAALVEKKIHKVCEPAFEAFDLNFLYYNFITPEGKLISIGTHSGWMKDYYSSSLFISNPYFCSPEHLNEGLHLFQLSGSKNIEQTRSLAQRKYDINPTCAIFRKSSKGCAQFGLGFSGQVDSALARAMNEIRLLEKFFDYFETEMDELIRKAEKYAVNIAEIKGQSFYDPPSSGTFRIDQVKKLKLVQAMNSLDENLVRLKFTPREKECIDLLLKDLTYKEIAHELSLSHRTVESYVETIRNKLGNSYRNELKHKLQTVKALGLC